MFTMPEWLVTGDHASRPAASAVAHGGLYSCTDHNKIYQTDGSSWSDWANFASSGIPATLLDAKGDLIAASAVDTAARLAVGSNGMVLVAASGETTGLQWDYPPGYELDYATFTAPVSITNTVEASADTIVSGASVAYDGTPIIIEFSASDIQTGSTANQIVRLWLFEDGSSIGAIAFAANNSTAAGMRFPISKRLKHTPSAGSHTYSIRGTVSGGSANVTVGAGGAAAHRPGFIRVTKA